MRWHLVIRALRKIPAKSSIAAVAVSRLCHSSSDSRAVEVSGFKWSGAASSGAASFGRCATIRRLSLDDRASIAASPTSKAPCNAKIAACSANELVAHRLKTYMSIGRDAPLITSGRFQQFRLNSARRDSSVTVGSPWRILRLADQARLGSPIIHVQRGAKST